MRMPAYYDDAVFFMDDYAHSWNADFYGLDDKEHVSGERIRNTAGTATNWVPQAYVFSSRPVKRG